MKKIITTFIVLCALAFGATKEQVENYLSLSNAEEQLIRLQQQYESMQQRLSSDYNVSVAYDMQLIPIRFRDYLQKNLSEDEMNEIIENYKHTLLMQFVAVTSDEASLKEVSEYLTLLEQDPNASKRRSLIKEIAKNYYNEEVMKEFFDTLIAPMYKKGVGAQEIDDKALKKAQKGYAQMMEEYGFNQLLYQTRDFGIEELKALSDLVKNSAFQKEIRVVYRALAFALGEYFNALTKFFNAKKHIQYSQQKEANR